MEEDATILHNNFMMTQDRVRLDVDAKGSKDNFGSISESITLPANSIDYAEEKYDASGSRRYHERKNSFESDSSYGRGFEDDAKHSYSSNPSVRPATVAQSTAISIRGRGGNEASRNSVAQSSAGHANNFHD